MFKNYQLVNGLIVESENNDSQIKIFFKPTIDDICYLSKIVGIDEYTINSVLDSDEIPRIDFEKSYISTILKLPKSNHGMSLDFRVMSYGLFLFKENLIIIFPENIPIFDWKGFKGLKSINDVFSKCVDYSTSHFMEHLKVINLLTDEIEQKINESMENKFLLNMFSLEKSLVYYLNAIRSNVMVIEKLKNSLNKTNFNIDEQDLLFDVHTESNQCLSQAEIYSDVLTGLMDARVSIVSNNLNLLLKLLTNITIFIMVPTLVASLFSMNVTLPFQLNQSPYGFWIIMLFAAGSFILSLLIWKIKKW